MADDFFADLVPMAPKTEKRPSEVGSQQTTSPFDQDSVIAHSPASDARTRSAEVPDLLGRESGPSGRHQASAVAPMGPSSSSRAQHQVKEFEDAVDATFRRFASGLQRILEDVNRRLEGLENQAERLSASVSDMREVDALREDAFKDRFAGLEKGLREVSRGVQLVRDKQELLEAQAELAKLARKSEGGADPLPPAPAESVKALPAAPPAQALALQPSAVEPPKQLRTTQQPMPEPTVPPMPPSPAHQAAATAAPQQPPQQQQHAAPSPAPAMQTAASAPPQQPSSQQYSAPMLPQQPPFHAPSPAQVQFQQSQPQFSASQQAPPQPSVAQGYPAQHPPVSPQMPPQPPPQPPQQPPQPPPQPQATQYSMPMSHPTPAPPPMKQFSGGSQQGFSPHGGSGGQPFGGGPPGSYSHSGHSPSPQGYQSGYPSLPQSQPSNQSAHRYHHSGGAPPPPPPSSGSYGGHSLPSRGSGGFRSSSYGSGSRPTPPPPPQQPGGQTASRNMPLEQVIDDVANMGFSRHDVRSVVSELMDKGQAVDLNVVLDRLMNGPR